jgi:hypothetical protein
MTENRLADEFDIPKTLQTTGDLIERSLRQLISLL